MTHRFWALDISMGPDSHRYTGRMSTLTRVKTFLAGYGRISEADDDEGIGNQRWFFDEWAEAEHPGAPTVWFEDNDVTGTTGDRGGFDQLREAIRRGEVRDLWVRDQSRLQRNEEVWFALRGELLTAGIVYLSTRNKGRVAVDDLVTNIQACIDADRVRQDRKNLMDRQRRDAEKGRPPATVVYGYKPAKINGERTLQVVEDQAERIRYIAREILSGRTSSSLAKEFAREGVKGARGAVITTSSVVESIVTSAAVAGLRRYQGDLVLGDDGKPLRGNWPAILDVDTWQDVQTVIDQRRRERKASSPAGGHERRRYVLSGLVRCARCDEAMHGAPVRGRRTYKCKRCGAGVTMDAADRVALDVVAERLSEASELAAEMTTDDDNAGRRDEIHRALDAIDARRAEVRQDRDDDLIDRDEYRSSMGHLKERKEALQAELTALVQPTSADDPDAHLLALSEARAVAEEGSEDARATLRALAHEWLTSVTVAPHVRGRAPETRIDVR